MLLTCLLADLDKCHVFVFFIMQNVVQKTQFKCIDDTDGLRVIFVKVFVSITQKDGKMGVEL